MNVMVESSLDPSMDTYTVLLVALAEQGDMEGLNSVFEECYAAEIPVSNSTLFEVILALAVSGHNQLVPQVILSTAYLITGADYISWGFLLYFE